MKKERKQREKKATSLGSGFNPAGEMSILVSETIQLIN